MHEVNYWVPIFIAPWTGIYCGPPTLGFSLCVNVKSNKYAIKTEMVEIPLDEIKEMERRRERLHKEVLMNQIIIWSNTDRHSER